MEQLSTNKIVIIGAGNAAYHFAIALKAIGKRVVQIYNRTEEKALTLATLIDAKATSKIEEIVKDADVYILAVNDSAVVELSKKLRFHDKIVIHIAGSLPRSLLNNISRRNGVMYPLQTLSVNSIINFSQIPLCLEASDDETLQSLAMLAYELSTSVFFFDSDRRKNLHLAAVFASNFVNCLNNIAMEIAAKQNIPFDLLVPIIEETSGKAQMGDFSNSQTGPAVRNDTAILKTQMEALKGYPDYQMLYKTFTHIIQEKSRQEASIYNLEG